MNEMDRLKSILDDLGYLNVYLNMYLVNTQKTRQFRESSTIYQSKSRFMVT